MKHLHYAPRNDEKYRHFSFILKETVELTLGEFFWNVSNKISLSAILPSHPSHYPPTLSVGGHVSSLHFFSSFFHGENEDGKSERLT